MGKLYIGFLFWLLYVDHSGYNMYVYTDNYFYIFPFRIFFGFAEYLYIQSNLPYVTFKWNIEIRSHKTGHIHHTVEVLLFVGTNQSAINGKIVYCIFILVALCGPQNQRKLEPHD
jgi:hypothetical protein